MSIFPLLLPEQDQPTAAAIVRAQIFINAHSSPPLSRSTRNFFELEIFSDDAARPKIKSHENLSNENFANERRQITVQAIVTSSLPVWCTLKDCS